MYLDESFRVDFRMPESLQEAIVDIDKAFRDGDDLHFALLLDEVETMAKQCAINGSITYTQLNDIFCRYGLR
ncbi:MAG: hypothetical protein Q4C60_06865 [Eubacteriales bacterium]|nr:hypothetical protein [Eubacteriales bacterium]